MRGSQRPPGLLPWWHGRSRSADSRRVPTAYVAAVNKALVAFLACLTVAAAATSVATNLARVSR